jgi:hypothetical protein
VNRRLIAISGLLALSVGLGGCRLLKKKSDAAPSATVVAAPVAPPPATVAPIASEAAAATALVEPPAPEDFEEEAFEKITEENFETELTNFEKELE